MIRIARSRCALLLVLFIFVLAPTPRGSAADAPEVGYVEDLVRTTSADAILRGGAEVPLERLTPIRNGDHFRLTDARAKVVLRIAGLPAPLVVSQANQTVPIASALPEQGFWSGLLGWVGSSVVVFDRSERTQTTAAIRGDGDGELAAPMLAAPQILASGRRSLAVGWLAPNIVTVRLSSGSKVIAEGKGVGGLWIGPALDLRPGKYVLTLKTPDATVSRDVTVADVANLPKPPAALTRADIPGGLGQTAQAVWFAAQGKQYLLEALQHVAGDANTFKPASIVVDALIAGRQPSPPP